MSTTPPRDAANMTAYLNDSDTSNTDPAGILRAAHTAVEAAWQATRLVPGNAGDWVRAALDNLANAIEAVK